MISCSRKGGLDLSRFQNQVCARMRPNGTSESPFRGPAWSRSLNFCISAPIASRNRKDIVLGERYSLYSFFLLGSPSICMASKLSYRKFSWEREHVCGHPTTVKKPSVPPPAPICLGRCCPNNAPSDSRRAVQRKLPGGEKHYGANGPINRVGTIRGTESAASRLA